MCGRFSQALPAEQLTEMFGALDVRLTVPPPSWNLAPMRSVTAVVHESKRKQRAIMQMDWGLLAPWARHFDGAQPFSARCETVATSRMFRAAFGKRRCLVAVDCWYEWQREEGRKIPHALARADGAPTVLGGIWECWRSPSGDRVHTLAILTTPANAELAPIHARMPLVLDPEVWPLWLGEADGDKAALLQQAAPGRIRAWRVDRAVGNPYRDGPELLQAA